MEKNNINVRSGITRKVTKRITLNSKATNIKILFNSWHNFNKEYNDVTRVNNWKEIEEVLL